jgi:hypothetical protein
VSTERVVAVDLSHCQHWPHLQSCWQNNPNLEAVKWNTVAKVGVAPRPPSLSRNIYPRESITISRISLPDSIQAHFAHGTSPRCILN